MKRNDIIIKFIDSGMSEEELDKFRQKFPKYYSVLYALYDFFNKVGIDTDDIKECSADDEDKIIRILFDSKKTSKKLQDDKKDSLYGLKKDRYGFKVTLVGSAAQIEYYSED